MDGQGIKHGKGTPPLPLYRDGEVVEAPAVQETLTQGYAGEARQFIRGNAKRPFFLYLSHTFPHTLSTVPLSSGGGSLPHGLRSCRCPRAEKHLLDGENILKLLTGDGKRKGKDFYYSRNDAKWAVRSGRWKLHLPRNEQKGKTVPAEHYAMEGNGCRHAPSGFEPERSGRSRRAPGLFAGKLFRTGSPAVSSAHDLQLVGGHGGGKGFLG